MTTNANVEMAGRLWFARLEATVRKRRFNRLSPDPVQAALDRAADQVRAAGEAWADVHTQAVRVILGERKDG